MDRVLRGASLRKWASLGGLLTMLAGAAWLPVAVRPAPSIKTLTVSLTGTAAPVGVTATPLTPASSCTNQFVTQTLDHVTAPRGAVVHQFDSNGSGVAIDDLNGDGQLDIVLANLNGPATILWNRGNFHFEKQVLPDENSLAVNLVDVDGDGRLDIVFTHSAAGVSYWHNDGAAGATAPTFTRQALANVIKPAHSMAWADLNGDGTLDFVTGSYDAELNLVLGNAFLFSDGAGVYAYTQQHGSFVPQRLSNKSQALAIALIDVNGDSRPDILVGNDFDMPDMTWLSTPSGWQAAAPFAQTAHHTMNFDWGDIDNNGSFELFSTDMNPYELGVQSVAHWLPMMATMTHRVPRGDPQTDTNVLQVLTSDHRYHNQATQRGVAATGWSWTGKFGDLNNDGFLDLYVVNGMIDSDLLGYLPQGELVEENQALRNLGDGTFVPATAWKLGSTSSGRGMSMADLNGDGQLDIVVNNLRSPAQLFENQLCGGNAVEVDLRWPASRNTHAIGAQVILRTSAGTFTRDVRASSGYLSGDPSRVHFGIPAGATISRLDILWPDGQVSSVAAPAPNARLTITR